MSPLVKHFKQRDSFSFRGPEPSLKSSAQLVQTRLTSHNYSPWELERAVTRFVDYYNHERLHEAIGNVTPDDMYHGRQREIFTHREKIKRLTLQRRKTEHLRNAA